MALNLSFLGDGPFWLFCRDFQPLTPPDTLDPLLVHRPNAALPSMVETISIENSQCPMKLN
jgi:hypothetical protein